MVLFCGKGCYSQYSDLINSIRIEFVFDVPRRNVLYYFETKSVPMQHVCDARLVFAS